MLAWRLNECLSAIEQLHADTMLTRLLTKIGCSILNERLCASEQLDADKIFRLLDVDASGLVRVSLL